MKFNHLAVIIPVKWLPQNTEDARTQACDWRLSAQDRGRKCLLLFTGCEFYCNDEVPVGLLEIRDGFEAMIENLEKELSKETRIIPLPLMTAVQRKEAA